MTNTKTSVTIGKKLGIGFGLLFAGTIGLAIYSLRTISYLGGEFDNVAQKETRKLDLLRSIDVTAAEMLSFERGIVTRIAMSDTAAAQRFHAAFAERTALMAKLVAEFRPMIATEGGKRNADAITAATSAWQSADEELWTASRARQLPVVRKILDERAIPLGAEIQTAAGEATQRQRDRIAQAAERGHAAIVFSRWITILLIGVCAMLGAGVLWVVKNSTRELKRMARELDESTSQIAGASAQVASSSQSLAQGASEQAASLEETSASAEEITSMTRKNADNSRVAAEVMATVDRHVK
ncbi:MAG TPA: MCP four helix bundle domain-containing protein, partial [Bryobacteraceae bacterium]|nr:MCP four helix bundle domain-containing protein [Bryobacteraceae bacterium]